MGRNCIFLSNRRGSEGGNSVSDLGSELREFGACKTRRCRTCDQVLRLSLRWNLHVKCFIVPFHITASPDPLPRDVGLWAGCNFPFKLRCQILYACLMINGVTPCGSSFQNIIFLQDCMLLGGLCLFFLKIDTHKKTLWYWATLNDENPALDLSGNLHLNIFATDSNSLLR